MLLNKHEHEHRRCRAFGSQLSQKLSGHEISPVAKSYPRLVLCIGEKRTFLLDGNVVGW